jgi:hypothetical protein
MYKKQKCLLIVLLVTLTALIMVVHFRFFNHNKYLIIGNLPLQINRQILKSSCSCKQETVEIEIEKDFYNINVLDTNGKKTLFKHDRKSFELENIKCDLYNVLRRGPQQKVVGLSLYGNDQFYYKELKYVIKLIAKYYPDWIARIHYDNTVNASLLCEIECLKNDKTNEFYDNIDFCSITEIPTGLQEGKIWNGNHVHAMKWRWFPIGDPYVDIFMSRDTDSWITQREYDSVDVWLRANTLFHVMRDHPYHNVPILGGLWGFKNKYNRQLGNSLFNLIIDKKIAKQYNNDGKHHKQGDQDFLAHHVWNLAKVNATVHASFFCDSFGSRTEPFPTQRPKAFCYISCIYCCEEGITDRNFTWACPEMCRPMEHKEWIHC